jgi:hypothetical protein
MSYSSDIGAGFAAVGNPGEAAQQANYVQQEQALDQRMADYINSNGGLGPACKVALVYHDFKALASDNFSGESQTECADFAQDQHVFAAIPTVLEDKTLITCLAQYHVVDLYQPLSYNPNPNDLAQYRGSLYMPDWIGTRRFAPFIHDLAAAGYFGLGAKVGILLADDGSGANQYLVNNLWLPALKAMGITPDVFTFTQVEGYSDVSTDFSQFSAAVLRFKAEGVNRVIDTADEGDSTFFFTPTAQSQDYHPIYALNSDADTAGWYTESAGQRPGAYSVSWSEADLGPASPSQIAAGNPASTNRAQCDSIFTGHTGSIPATMMYRVCDDFFFLQAALKGASSVTPQTLLAGADRLGSSLSLADDYSNALIGPLNHYDGGTSVRVMRWNEAAQEWQYMSPAEATP